MNRRTSAILFTLETFRRDLIYIVYSTLVKSGIRISPSSYTCACPFYVPILRRGHLDLLLSVRANNCDKVEKWGHLCPVDTFFFSLQFAGR